MKHTLIAMLLMLFLVGCVTAPDVIPSEKWQVDFGSDQWEIGSQAQNRTVRITEFVPAGETVENWSQIVTDQFISGHFPTTTVFLQANIDGLRRRVDGFESAVIYDTGTEALYEWWHPDSGKWPAEHQLTLVKYYPTGMMTLSYAKKGSQMDESLRVKWIDRFKNAKLR